MRTLRREAMRGNVHAGAARRPGPRERGNAARLPAPYAAGVRQEILGSANMQDPNEMLAGSTGLEPAASGVTGRRSNQLNYDPKRDVASVHLRAPRYGGQPSPGWQPKLWLRARARAKVGGRCRARTCDTRRVKPVLYQLS